MHTDTVDGVRRRDGAQQRARPKVPHADLVSEAARDDDGRRGVDLGHTPLVLVSHEVLPDCEGVGVDDGDGAVHGAGYDSVALEADAPDGGAVVVQDV